MHRSATEQGIETLINQSVDSNRDSENDLQLRANQNKLCKKLKRKKCREKEKSEKHKNKCAAFV